MTAAALMTLVMQWAPVVIAAASAANAAIPPATANSHPAFKTVSTVLDWLALNVGNAKK